MEQLRAASHIGLWIAVIAVGVFLSWSAVNKKSEDTTYKPGSVDAHREYNTYPLGLSFAGCEYIRPDTGQPLRHDFRKEIKK